MGPFSSQKLRPRPSQQSGASRPLRPPPTAAVPPRQNGGQSQGQNGEQSQGQNRGQSQGENRGQPASRLKRRQRPSQTKRPQPDHWSKDPSFESRSCAVSLYITTDGREPWFIVLQPEGPTTGEFIQVREAQPGRFKVEIAFYAEGGPNPQREIYDLGKIDTSEIEKVESIAKKIDPTGKDCDLTPDERQNYGSPVWIKLFVGKLVEAGLLVPDANRTVAELRSRK